MSVSLRQWAGICEMPPDYSPIMGFTPVNGFLIDVGLGYLWIQKRPPLPAKPWQN